MWKKIFNYPIIGLWQTFLILRNQLIWERDSYETCDWNHWKAKGIKNVNHRPNKNSLRDISQFCFTFIKYLSFSAAFVASAAFAVRDKDEDTFLVLSIKGSHWNKVKKIGIFFKETKQKIHSITYIHFKGFINSFSYFMVSMVVNFWTPFLFSLHAVSHFRLI